MRCPICKSYQVRCIDSRPYDDQIRRRRECSDCGARVSTIEIPITKHKELKNKAHELDILKGGTSRA